MKLQRETSQQHLDDVTRRASSEQEEGGFWFFFFYMTDLKLSFRLQVRAACSPEPRISKSALSESIAVHIITTGL